MAGVEAPVEAPVYRHRGCEGAVAEAEGLVELDTAVRRTLAHPHAELLAGLCHERFGAHRLAGLGATEPDHRGGGRLGSEVAVVRDDSVDLRSREVELVGDDGNCSLVDVAEVRLHGMEDLDEGTAFVAVRLHERPYPVLAEDRCLPFELCHVELLFGGVLGPIVSVDDARLPIATVERVSDISSDLEASSAQEVIALAGQIAEEVLFPASLATDAAPAVPRRLLDVLADAGLYGVYAARASGGLELEREAGEEVISLLASGCLTTTFVWLQHLSTAAVVSRLEGTIREEWARDLATGTRRSGIAFSHLRHPERPGPTARAVKGGYLIDGTAPLVSGWGLIDVLHVAAVMGGDIGWLLVDASPGPSLVPTRLDLAAVNASATVSLHFSRHFVDRSRLTTIEPLSEWLARDAAGLRTNGFLALGVARRCLSLLREAGECSGAAGEVELALQSARAALVSSAPDDLPETRARVSLLALDLAGALVASGGGRSMVRTAQAQRLGREAMFLLVQGQTGKIRSAQLRLLRARSTW